MKKLHLPPSSENKGFVSRLLPDSNTQKLLFVTLGIFLLMTALRPGMFLTAQNFTSMMFQAPELGFFSVAMAFVIIGGGIDLSVVATANISAIASAYFLLGTVRKDASGSAVIWLILLVFLMGAAIGAICGAVNGVIISRFNINPMLATLGTMYLLTGIGVLITRGRSVSGMPPQLLVLGSGYLLGIPIPMWMLVAALVVAAIILGGTRYGFELRMCGSNSIASWFSGIHNPHIIMRTYIFSGILSGLTGVEFLARTNSAKADFGTSYVLHAILCALLGGIKPEGGHGRIAGIALSLISLQFLASGFNMLRVSAFFKEFVWGVLLLLVMTLNFLSNQRSLNRVVKAAPKEEET